MEKQTVASIDGGTTKVGTTIDDLRLRMAEYVIAQDDCYGTADVVRSILAETKAGARRRSALLEKLRVVFAAA